MVFEAHGMSFPCTELLLFNYAKVNIVFHSMAPLSEILTQVKHLYQYKNKYRTFSLNTVQCALFFTEQH